VLAIRINISINNLFSSYKYVQLLQNYKQIMPPLHIKVQLLINVLFIKVI